MTTLATWADNCSIDDAKATLKKGVQDFINENIEAPEKHVMYCFGILQERVIIHDLAELVAKVIDKNFECRLWSAKGVLEIEALQNITFEIIAEGCQKLAEQRGYKNPIKYYAALMNEAIK